jgi:hypothetical protein
MIRSHAQGLFNLLGAIFCIPLWESMELGLPEIESVNLVIYLNNNVIVSNMLDGKFVKGVFIKQL